MSMNQSLVDMASASDLHNRHVQSNVGPFKAATFNNDHSLSDLSQSVHDISKSRAGGLDEMQYEPTIIN